MESARKRRSQREKPFPDLLLSIHTSVHNLHDLHALFNFREDTGALMIKPLPGRMIKTGTEEFVGHEDYPGRTVPNVATTILIGRLFYTVQCTNSDKQRYLAGRDYTMFGNSRSEYDTSESTPGDSTFVLHGNELEGPTTYDVYGVLLRGSNWEEVYFTVKRVLRIKNKYVNLTVEINIMKRIGQRVSIHPEN